MAQKRFRTIRGFRDFGKELTSGALSAVHDEMAEASKRAKTYAQANAPVDTGYHRSTIFRRSRKLAKGAVMGVGARADYSPYLEFGTGVYVSVPAGVEDIAAAFKGSGGQGGSNKARPHIVPALVKSLKEAEVPILDKISKL